MIGVDALIVVGFLLILGVTVLPENMLKRKNRKSRLAEQEKITKKS